MPEETEVQISVSGLPETLLTKIDAIADREHRPRNRQIVKWLEEAVASEMANFAAAAPHSKRKAA